MKKTLIIMIVAVLLITSVVGASGFVDVPQDAYYADAVAWAKENNVTLITAEHMEIINDKRAKEKKK